MTADIPARHEATFRVASDHPSLPGHFPGNPVVPGVVILDEVIGAAERCLGAPLHVVAMPAAKFVAPLLPERVARIELAQVGPAWSFAVTDGGTTIARGSFTARPVTP